VLMLFGAWRRRGEPHIPGWSNRASRCSTLSALLWLAFILSLLLAVILLAVQGESALYHFPNTSLIASQWIGRIASAVSIITAVLLPALLFDTYRGFKQRGIAIVWVGIILLAVWVLWNAQLTAW
jgi:hypothetical protein